MVLQIMSLTLLTIKIDKISKYTSQFMFKVSKTLITMAVSFGHGIDDWNQCAPAPSLSEVSTIKYG